MELHDLTVIQLDELRKEAGMEVLRAERVLGEIQKEYEVAYKKLLEIHERIIKAQNKLFRAELLEAETEFFLVQARHKEANSETYIEAIIEKVDEEMSSRLEFKLNFDDPTSKEYAKVIDLAKEHYNWQQPQLK